jgi:hypothetical protein
MSWSSWFDLTPTEVANVVPTTPGVFCIARKTSSLTYPSGASSTVLLGAAPDRQRGLRAVLVELASGKRDDLEAQRKQDGGLRFCFQGNLGDAAASLHTALIADFIRQHGGAPFCNAGR